MKLSDLLAGQLVGLRGAEVGLHDAFENVSIEFCCLIFTLWDNVFGHEPVRQFSHRWGAALRGFLSRRVLAMRHRAQDDLGSRPRVFWSDFANSSNRVAPNRCAAACASSIDYHVGHCACGP